MSKAKLTEAQLADMRDVPPSAFQWVERTQQYKPKPNDIYQEELEKYNASSSTTPEQ